MPGITLKVCLICSSNCGLSFADGTFMRMRPGIWCAICNFIFVIANPVFLKFSQTGNVLRRTDGATNALCSAHLLPRSELQAVPRISILATGMDRAGGCPRRPPDSVRRDDALA